jgi:hypothetical protein
MVGNTQLLHGETTALQWKASDDSNYREHRNNDNDSNSIYRAHESNRNIKQELRQFSSDYGATNFWKEQNVSIHTATSNVSYVRPWPLLCTSLRNKN